MAGSSGCSGADVAAVTWLPGLSTRRLRGRQARVHVQGLPPQAFQSVLLPGGRQTDQKQVSSTVVLNYSYPN